jgi:hypothetical protein
MWGLEVKFADGRNCFCLWSDAADKTAFFATTTADYRDAFDEARGRLRSFSDGKFLLFLIEQFSDVENLWILL